MNNVLYLICESSKDAHFYKLLVKKILPHDFDFRIRQYRKGGGLAKAKEVMKMIFYQYRFSPPYPSVYFLVVVDNDRAPYHPNNICPLDPAKKRNLPHREKNKACRYTEMHKLAEEYIHPNLGWLDQCALVIPREMLESWLLVMSNNNQHTDVSKLPKFAYKTDEIAKKYHGRNTPNQLKDLVEEEQQALGLYDPKTYYGYCAQCCDIELMAQNDDVFQHFKTTIESWDIVNS